MAGMYMPELRALTHGVEGTTRARIAACPLNTCPSAAGTILFRGEFLWIRRNGRPTSKADASVHFT
jgi:hypothetical protein